MDDLEQDLELHDFLLNIENPIPEPKLEDNIKTRNNLKEEEDQDPMPIIENDLDITSVTVRDKL